MPLESQFKELTAHLSEDSVDQMLVLAERLRSASGGDLDDSAIQAVSEATGAPVEYVRLAVKMRAEQQKKSFTHRLRAQYLLLEPSVRRNVLSGGFSALSALFMALSAKTAGWTNSPRELLAVGAIVWLTLGLYNACTTRDNRSGAIAGAIFGAGAFAAYELFTFVLGVHSPGAGLIIFTTLAGAFVGYHGQRMTDLNRGKLGLKDPAKERQDLLRQLVDLQDKLKSAEQACTFLSVDIVGSTKIKELADPLSVEFTFNEYQHFVDRIVTKYGGTVHSTAGDGVTAAFDHPQPAFLAARNIQAGLIELNAHRNRTGMPIRVRQGIHSGKVMTVEQGDLTSVNFAHVIDVAAHLQKLAPIGGIVVSDISSLQLPGGADAIGEEAVQTSNVTGRIWIPKAVATVGVSSEAPPAPQSAP